MDAKEKALQLCQNFAYLGKESEQTNYRTLDLDLAKGCAKVCVKEILANATLNKEALIYLKQVLTEIDNV